MEKERLPSLLKEIYLFAFMSESELERLAEISSIHNYENNSYLFMQGEKSEHLLILIEGVVSVFKHDSKGNEIIIGLFRPYSLLAEPAILKGVPFPSTAVFKTKGSVIKVKLNAFIEGFLSDPHISYEVIQSLLGKIQLLQQNIHLNIASSAKEKILHFYQQNGTLENELKHYEIASLLGMTAETFSRNLKQLLLEEKLIKGSSGYQIA